jgi:hypothetical protein
LQLNNLFIFFLYFLKKKKKTKRLRFITIETT